MKQPPTLDEYVQAFLTHMRAPLKTATTFTPAGRTVLHRDGERVIFGPRGEKIKVVLTRTTDVNLTGAARAKKTRETGAKAFVCLQFNGLGDKTVSGTETFYRAPQNGNVNLAAAAQKLWGAGTPAALTDALSNVVFDSITSQTKGGRRAEFGLCKFAWQVVHACMHARMRAPAALTAITVAKNPYTSTYCLFTHHIASHADEHACMVNSTMQDRTYLDLPFQLIAIKNKTNTSVPIGAKIGGLNCSYAMFKGSSVSEAA